MPDIILSGAFGFVCPVLSIILNNSLGFKRELSFSNVLVRCTKMKGVSYAKCRKS
uniref:Uncharacterized protein n=1 Tax=Siphoviridae sp. ctNHj22 TaxID=2825468 RepID=A0A8S5VFL1_9CAUD|nr:MAG TPA: hypothetical protein [Siphoviridae sp. ctNHj22]